METKKELANRWPASWGFSLGVVSHKIRMDGLAIRRLLLDGALTYGWTMSGMGEGLTDLIEAVRDEGVCELPGAVLQRLWESGESILAGRSAGAYCIVCGASAEEIVRWPALVCVPRPRIVAARFNIKKRAMSAAGRLR